MSLRLIEIYSPDKKIKKIEKLFEGGPVFNMWDYDVPGGGVVTKIVLEAEDTEQVLSTLEKKLKPAGGVKVVILPAEGIFPRPKEEKPTPKASKKEVHTVQGVSLEELYQAMTDVSGLSRRFVLLSALAAFVAALGLLKNDVAVVIGAMVIAPLLGPNMALSLATTLADAKLARRAAATGAAGVALVLLIGIVMGSIITVDPGAQQMAARSAVSHYYIFLALATGVAGAYSVTSSMASALVGVMVSVALLPPLVAAGLLLGAHNWVDAAGAFLLFLVNVVGVNLSGVVTFLFQGVRPRKLWEARKAEKAVMVAVIVWAAALLVLAVLIYLEQRLRRGF